MSAQRMRDASSVVAATCLAAAVLVWMSPTWIPQPTVAAVLGVLAVLGRALASDATPTHRSQVIVEAGLLGIAGLLAPSGWRPLLVSGACADGVLAVAGSPRAPARIARRVANALREVVLAGVSVVVVVRAVAELDFGFDRVTCLAPPLALMLRFLGIRAAAVDGSLAVDTLHGTAMIPLTLSTAGAYALAAVWVAHIALATVGGMRWRAGRTLAVTSTLVAAAVVRLVAAFPAALQYEMLLNFDDRNRPLSFLVQPLFQVALLAAVAAPALLAMSGEPARAPAAPSKRGALQLASFVSAVSAGLAILLFAEDIGERKPGRVMIDESHSEWEAVSPAYDTNWYGSDSGYNYAGIAEYLGHFYSVAVNRGFITPEVLRDVDVLILKIPTRGYDASEQAAIADFVRNGGGLFLIGEHTNVWGSGYYLNELARRFGFEFRYNVVFDLRRTFEERYRPPDLGRHPMVAGIRDFLFEVGCSINPRALHVRPALWVGGLWTLESDYAVGNFYPEANATFDADVGPLVQGVAVHIGRGRVAGFTDSTVWSNFSAMLPGKPELLLGTIEWLDRRNRVWDLYAYAKVSVVLAALAVAWAAWARPALAGILVAASLVGSLLGAAVASAPLRAYTPPRPDSHLRAACFVEDTTTYELGSWGFVSNRDRSYAIFYQWLMRLGIAPAVIHASDPLPPYARLLVAVAGARGLRREVTAAADGALDRGVPVLLLVTTEGDGAADWLARRGIRLERDSIRTSTSLKSTERGAEWGLHWRTQHRLGGGTTLLEADGRPVLVRAQGAPLHVLIGCEEFSDSGMGGDQGNVPDAALRKLYELEFSLMRGLVGGGLGHELQQGASNPLTVVTSPKLSLAPPLDRPASRTDRP